MLSNDYPSRYRTRTGRCRSGDRQNCGSAACCGHGGLHFCTENTSAAPHMTCRTGYRRSVLFRARHRCGTIRTYFYRQRSDGIADAYPGRCCTCSLSAQNVRAPEPAGSIRPVSGGSPIPGRAPEGRAPLGRASYDRSTRSSSAAAPCRPGSGREPARCRTTLPASAHWAAGTSGSRDCNSYATGSGGLLDSTPSTSSAPTCSDSPRPRPSPDAWSSSGTLPTDPGRTPGCG